MKYDRTIDPIMVTMFVILWIICFGMMYVSLTVLHGTVLGSLIRIVGAILGLTLAFALAETLV